MDHQGLGAVPLLPDELHKVQEVGGVIGHAMVWPGHILQVEDRPLLPGLSRAKRGSYVAGKGVSASINMYTNHSWAFRGGKAKVTL